VGVIQFRQPGGVWSRRFCGEGWAKDELRQHLQYLRREYPENDWRIVWKN
jgi:hypothetical protein